MFSSLSLSTILTIVKSLLDISTDISEYMKRKQIISAGKAIKQKETLEEARDATSKAIAARRAAESELDADGMPGDYKYYRD